MWGCDFFFKPKAANEMLRNLVGSGMWIRDRVMKAICYLVLQKVIDNALHFDEGDTEGCQAPSTPITSMKAEKVKLAALPITAMKAKKVMKAATTIPMLCLSYTSDAADE